MERGETMRGKLGRDSSSEVEIHRGREWNKSCVYRNSNRWERNGKRTEEWRSEQKL
jgi:hypothetical protein